jgi:hypothetical protein
MSVKDDEDDGKVIDLQAYLQRKEEEAEAPRSVFSFYGGDGERSRFALPLWRAAYMASGMRAALVSVDREAVGDKRVPEVLVVLDLREEPARMEYTNSFMTGLPPDPHQGAQAIGHKEVVVYLGEHHDRKWYLVVDDLGPPEDPAEHERDLRDLLFLAGECAGLLFHRGLAESTGGGADDGI